MVRSQRFVSLSELLLRDPSHEVNQLEEDEVDVGNVIANEELLVTKECNQRFDFFKQVHCDGNPVSCSVARHRYSSLQVSNNSSDHFYLRDFTRCASKQLWTILVCDVFHDGHCFSHFHVSINVVGQVGELESECVLLVEPGSSGVFRTITLFVNLLLVVYIQIDELVSDL